MFALGFCRSLLSVPSLMMTTLNELKDLSPIPTIALHFYPVLFLQNSDQSIQTTDLFWWGEVEIWPPPLKFCFHESIMNMKKIFLHGRHGAWSCADSPEQYKSSLPCQPSFIVWRQWDSFIIAREPITVSNWNATMQSIKIGNKKCNHPLLRH